MLSGKHACMLPCWAACWELCHCLLLCADLCLYVLYMQMAPCLIPILTPSCATHHTFCKPKKNGLLALTLMLYLGYTNCVRAHYV